MLTKEESRQAVRQLVDKYNQLNATQRQQLTEADVIHQFDQF